MQKSEKLKLLWKKINNPPNWLAILSCIATLVVCPTAAIALALDEGHTIYAFIAAGIAAIPLLYMGFVTVIACKRLCRKLGKVADKFKFTRNLHKNYEFRSIFFGACSLVCNVGYTIFLCVTAIRYRSTWYGALAVYYILLSTARGGVLGQNAKDTYKYRYDLMKLQKAKAVNYRYCGFMMSALSLALSLSVIQMFVDGASFYTPKPFVFAFAAFAVYRIIMAIYNFVKASKKDDLVVRAVRYVNLITALVTLLSLQTAIFAALRLTLPSAIVNAVTGSIVCLVAMSLGIYMISFSHAVCKKLKLEEELLKRESEKISPYNREDYREEYGEENATTYWVEDGKNV